MEENLKIFVCTHKDIECEVPQEKEYVILSQMKEVTVEGHGTIVVDDEFTRRHNICYGEGCQMRWLWQHPEILPEYVGLCHYRRYFDEFNGEFEQIPAILEKFGAIVKKPHFHNRYGKTNLEVMRNRHIAEEADTLIDVVKKCGNQGYVSAFEKMLSEWFYSPCNIFIMRREDFLEMCSIIFGIMDEYDRRRKFTSNDDVKQKVLEHWMLGKTSNCSLGWHNRLQGFWLEWLTHTFYQYRFGENNLYYADVWMRKEPNEETALTVPVDISSCKMNRPRETVKRTVVYVCTAKDEIYVKRLQFSIYTLKYFNDCNVVVLTDSTTQFNEYIEKNATIRRFKIDNDGVKYRSRWLKTQIPEFVEGSWVFIDLDTVIIGGLSELDDFTGIQIANEGNNRRFNVARVKYRFKDWDEPVYGHYYNSGVIVGDENSKEFFRKVHENWLDYIDKVGYKLDQQAISKTNRECGLIIKPLPDKYNWQIKVRRTLPEDTIVIHYYGADKRPSVKNFNVENIIKKDTYQPSDILKAIYSYKEQFSR